MPVTNVHPLFSEWFTVNGESMATYGWSVESVTTGLPERKGENVTSPIMHGSMFREKRFGPRTDTWNIWVCDADPVTGVIPDTENGKRAQFNKNMDYVNSIFNSLTPYGLQNGSLIIEKYYQVPTPQIGDIGPGGGKVFITPSTVGNTTGKYFEVVPLSAEVKRRWADIAYQSTTVTGADGTAIGTGYQNTLDIIAQGNTAANSAAAYAGALVFGDYSDWFLPSKDELNQIFINRVALGDDFVSNPYYAYWDSTEYSGEPPSSTFASFQYFTNGEQSLGYKYSVYGVRAVRSFTVENPGYLEAFAEVSGSYSYEDAKQFNCATFSVDITYPSPLWREFGTTTLSLTGSSVPLTYYIPSYELGNAPVTSMVITITAVGGTVVNPIITNGAIGNYPSQIGYTGTILSGQSVVIDTSDYTVTLNSNNAISSVFRGGYRQEWFEFLPGLINAITLQSTSGNFTVSFAYKKAYF